MNVRWACAAAALLAGLLAPGDAAAAPRLARVFGDHMVLQRDVPIRLWGWAAPGEALEVEFRGGRRRTVADGRGRFTLELEPTPAGGPYELTLHGDGTFRLTDLWVGDVWVAGGQSNMEWALRDADGGMREAVRAAADEPGVRHLKVPHRASLRPREDIDAAPWQRVQPASAGDISAVAQFFARDLSQAVGVPVGIVNVSWGGTHVETWTSPRAAAADPDLAAVVRDLPATQPAFDARRRERMAAIATRWQGERLPPDDEPGQWADPAHDDRHWRTLDVPRVWEEQGLNGFDGFVWYRRSVELSAEQARGAATLSLGMIDDCDETWVNGHRVGGLCQWDAPRRYALGEGLLRPGRNVIAVRVTDTGGAGGFHGDAAAVRLETDAGAMSLAGAWRARVEGPWVPEALQANDAPTLAFNGMVHPLLGLPVRGFVWYQGESNVPRAARYAGAFQALIRDWRSQWAKPAPGGGERPFYFVQIASFLPLARNSLAGSEWAELREAQAQALAQPATGMAVAIDVGDADDIHPRNKQAVGERLARLALRQSYGQAIADRGPRLSTWHRDGPRAVLAFDTDGGMLAVRGGGELRGFAIAGADRRFVPARARIEGDTVLVWHDAVSSPLAVRYAWVDNAGEANLVGRDGLPAAPFRTDDWPRLTRDARYEP